MQPADLVPGEVEGNAEDTAASAGAARRLSGYLVQNEPILAGIFAFSGAPLRDLGERLKAVCQDPVSRVPLVCVLDQGVISYVRGSELAPHNAFWRDARLAFTPETYAGEALHFFYAMLAYGVSRKKPIAPSYRSYAELGPFDLTYVD